MTAHDDTQPDPDPRDVSDRAAVPPLDAETTATVQAALRELDELPVEAHVAVFDRLHRRLRDRLDDSSDESMPRPRDDG